MSPQNESNQDVDLDILKDFVVESLSNLEHAVNALLKLEQNPDDKTHVDTAFRIFHTIKGASSFFDLKLVKNFSHVMENLLSEVKKGKRHVDGRITSLLLNGIDLLKAMLERATDLQTPQEMTKEEKAYFEQLEAVLNTKEPSIEDLASLFVRDWAQAQKAEGMDPAFLQRLYDFLKRVGGPKAAPLAVPTKNADFLAPKISAETTVAPAPTKKTMRIDESTVDVFLNYTGELISLSESFSYLQGKLEQENLKHQTKSEFKSAALSFQVLSQDLQKSIMDIRKVSLNALFAKYPRLVRDLALSLQKKVVFEMRGDDLRVDKSIIELLDDPLVHILRNSMDHGFESNEERLKTGKAIEGRLLVEAKVDDSFLYLRIEDDGRGIDPEKIKNAAITKGLLTPEKASLLNPHEILALIFTPGFSMAEKVSDVSGRGVGMDVVWTNMKKANGSVEIKSVLGKGTEILLKVPLSVTTLITKALIVVAKDEQIIVPLDLLHAVETVTEEGIHTIKGVKETIDFRGQIIPLIRLTESLGWKGEGERNTGTLNVAILNIDHQLLGVAIDKLVGIQQIALKEVEKILSKNPLIKGGAILRDGRVGLLLDFKSLFQETRSLSPELKK